MKINTLNVGVFLIVVAIFFSGCAQKAELPEQPEEEVVDSGVIVIESSPSQAQVYVDGELKGSTPLTLYNIPVGTYNIAVQRNGYSDFEKTVAVKVGKTEEINVILTPLAKPEEKPAEPAEEIKNISSQFNRINLSSFAMYYDFGKAEFTELRTSTSDLFSRKYETYVHFTALTPTKIYVVNKPIKNVQKEDCIFSDNAVAIVYSDQTLCVKTLEGSVVAIGGSWQTMPAELEWIMFS